MRCRIRRPKSSQKSRLLQRLANAAQAVAQSSGAAALGLIYCVLLMQEVGYVASSKVQILGREFVITFQVEILH